MVVALKYLLPALLVPFPFFAGVANFVLDSVDGDLLIPLGLSDPVYQNIDKSADWVTYLCMVVAAWRWPLRRVIVALFAFRTVGQVLFFITGDELVFFLSRTSSSRCSSPTQRSCCSSEPTRRPSSLATRS